MFHLSQMCCVCEAWNCKFYDILSTNDGDLKLIDKLKHCVPEVELLSTQYTRYMCQSCCENLDIVFQFKLMCIKTHKNLNIYSEKLKIDSKSRLGQLKIKGDIPVKNEFGYLPDELVTVYRVEVIKELDEQDESNVDQEDLNFLRQDLNNMISEIPLLNNEIKRISTTIIKKNALSNKPLKTFLTINDKEKKTIAYDILTGNRSVVIKRTDNLPENRNKQDGLVTKNISDDIVEKIIDNDNKGKITDNTVVDKTSLAHSNKRTNDMFDDGIHLNGFCTREIHKSVIEIKKTVSVINQLDQNILDNKSLLYNPTEMASNIFDSKYSCTICKKKFTKISDLNIHHEVSHKKTYICLICMKFVNNNLRVHLQSHFSREAKYFLCKTCKERFPTKYAINEHNLKHHGSKEFYCSICRQFFMYKHLLNKHNFLKHDISKNHTCKICYKSFKLYTNFKRHNYVHDKSNRPFKCEHCPKAFCLKDALKKHILSHTNEKPFSCTLCDKKYARNETLKDHIASYHNNQNNKQKSYACTICEKKFKMFKEFKLHRKIHRYETPFGCIICGKNFRIEAQLNHHIANHS